jgi:sirohydrochlorin cobaltochelatase
MAGMADPVLLAVAHGTASRPGIEVLHALMDRVRALAPGVTVELAFVDHEPPSVRAALAGLAETDRPVGVVPLLLTAASHSKGDIAGTIKLTRAGQPSADLRYGRPLGLDPLLLASLADRLAEAGGGAESAVVLAAAGAADPDANAEIWRAARLLWEYRGGGPPVEPAYASATTPTVTDAIARLRLLGHTDIVVIPYFLAPGHFSQAVQADARAAGVRPAEVLGAHDAIAHLVLARWSEALGNQVLMNCDTCLYRAPWPGREDKHGQPQRPHAHPSDV